MTPRHPIVHPAPPPLLCRSYPRNRGAQVESEYGSIRASLARVYTAAHEILKRLATMKPADSPLRGREVVPAWLAAAAGANAARAEAGSYIDRVLSHRGATYYSAGWVGGRMGRGGGREGESLPPPVAMDALTVQCAQPLASYPPPTRPQRRLHAGRAGGGAALLPSLSGHAGQEAGRTAGGPGMGLAVERLRGVARAAPGRRRGAAHHVAPVAAPLPQHLDPVFYAKQRHRVAGGGRERSLAGSILPEAAGDGGHPWVSPDRPDSEAPHFVAEVFFATQVGLACGGA